MWFVESQMYMEPWDSSEVCFWPCLCGTVNATSCYLLHNILTQFFGKHWFFLTFNVILRYIIKVLWFSRGSCRNAGFSATYLAALIPPWEKCTSAATVTFWLPGGHITLGGGWISSAWFYLCISSIGARFHYPSIQMVFLNLICHVKSCRIPHPQIATMCLVSLVNMILLSVYLHKIC
jgi:hypothetical protein